MFIKIIDVIIVMIGLVLMIIAIEQNNNLLRIHLSMVDGSNHIIHDSKGNVLGKLELKGNNLSFECFIQR